MTKNPSDARLPKPRHGGGAVKVSVLAVGALCLAGALAYWVTRDDTERTHLRRQATTILEQSPVGEVAGLFASPPPPPSSLTHPSTQPGTLSGQIVQGGVMHSRTEQAQPSAEDFIAIPQEQTDPDMQPRVQNPMADNAAGARGHGANGAGTTVVGSTGLGQAGSDAAAQAGNLTAVGDPAYPAVLPDGTMPQVQEDSVVRSDFINDAAQWLVARYRSGQREALSVAAINARYGTKLHGLHHAGTDVYRGRAAVLRYIFNEPMLTALYGLYADRFVRALGDAAAHPRTGTPLTAEQTESMYRSYAGQFSTLGAAMQGMASVSNLPERLDKIRKLGQQSTNLYGQIREAVFALNQAREGGNSSVMQTAQLRVDGLNAQYRRCIGERDSARDQLVNAIHSVAPQTRTLDGDTLLFIASWLERRGGDNNRVPQTTLTAANLLEDLSSRLQHAGGR